MSAAVTPSTTIRRRQGKRRNNADRIAKAAVKTRAFQNVNSPSRQPAKIKLLSKTMNRPANSRRRVERRTAGDRSSGLGVSKDGGGNSSSLGGSSGVGWVAT